VTLALSHEPLLARAVVTFLYREGRFKLRRVSARVTLAGGGATGHPAAWIAVTEKAPEACVYCSLRYIKKKTEKVKFRDWQTDWQDQQ